MILHDDDHFDSSEGFTVADFLASLLERDIPPLAYIPYRQEPRDMRGLDRSDGRPSARVKHNNRWSYPFIGLATMSVKNAATFAFVGSLLAAALLVGDFVFDLVNAVRSLIAPVKLFPSLLYALAAVSLTLFFYAFRKNAR